MTATHLQRMINCAGGSVAFIYTSSNTVVHVGGPRYQSSVGRFPYPFFFVVITVASASSNVSGAVSSKALAVCSPFGPKGKILRVIIRLGFVWVVLFLPFQTLSRLASASQSWSCLLNFHAPFHIIESRSALTNLQQRSSRYCVSFIGLLCVFRVPTCCKDACILGVNRVIFPSWTRTDWGTQNVRALVSLCLGRAFAKSSLSFSVHAPDDERHAFSVQTTTTSSWEAHPMVLCVSGWWSFTSGGPTLPRELCGRLDIQKREKPFRRRLEESIRPVAGFNIRTSATLRAQTGFSERARGKLRLIIVFRGKDGGARFLRLGKAYLKFGGGIQRLVSPGLSGGIGCLFLFAKVFFCYSVYTEIRSHAISRTFFLTVFRYNTRSCLLEFLSLAAGGRIRIRVFNVMAKLFGGVRSSQDCAEE